jgi:hypothetical protein
MGTQQILLIVLSVIIVGAAIAVGITMFNNQAYSANKSAIASDAQSFGTQIVQYYKTPESQGGAGKKVENMTSGKILEYIGWGTDTTLDNENGIFSIDVDDPFVDEVTVLGDGKEVKSAKQPHVETVITFPDGTMKATVTDIDE